MKFLSHKKIISLSLIIVFIAQSILLFTNIPEVHADVPVNVQGVAQVKEVGQNLKENIKTSAATKSLQQKEVGGSGLLGKLS